MDDNLVGEPDGCFAQSQPCIDAEPEKLDIAAAVQLQRQNQTITYLRAVNKDLTESLEFLERGKLLIAFTQLKRQNDTIKNLTAVNKDLKESLVSLQAQLYVAFDR